MGDRHENAPVSHSPSNRQFSPTFGSPQPNDSSMLRTPSLQETLAEAHEQIQQSLLEQSLLEQSLLEQSFRDASDRTRVPPASFISNALVPFLLPLGPSLFGDRSRANCILNTHTQRFYVHVQMLAARSPVFQHIFDEMVVNGAWGDADSDDEDIDEDVDEDKDDGGVVEGNSEEDEGDYGDDDDEYEEDDDDYDEDDDPDDQFTNDEEDNAFEVQDQSRQNLGSSGQDYPQGRLSVLNVTWRKIRTKSKRGQDQRSHYGHSGGNVDDVEEEGGDDYEADYDYDLDLPENSNPYLGADYDEYDEYGEPKEKVEEEDEEDDVDDGDYPELIMDFADPEGSRFEELLYWLYTNDGPRWLASFTPQNYEDILKNIGMLCILTPAVLSICQAFEESTSLDLGLRGLANRAMKQVPIAKSTALATKTAIKMVTGRGRV